jgi:dienelactone hydrolase
VVVTIAQAALPTVSLAASPASISSGANSTLTWSSTNATGCTSTGAWSGARATSGTLSVTPTATSTYTLYCSGAGGNSSPQSATVTVSTAAAPTLSFSASPATIVSGANSTLTWSSTNASTCNASGAWSGTKATSGTFTTPALAVATTYTLGCTGAGGTASKTVTVSLAGDAPTAASASTIGPYTVATFTSGIGTGAHYLIPKIYYPSNGVAPYPGVVFIAGNNTSYTEPPYTVVIGGKTVVEVDMTQWGTLLASHGFVVMFIDPVNQSALPTERATALSEAVNALAAESTRAGSPLLGKLQDQNIAVMGHSYGGAGALYLANAGSNARVKAAIGLSPIPVNTLYPSDALPILILSGVGDPYFNDFPGQYASIPATTSKAEANFLKTAEWDSMHSVAMMPLGWHASDPTVARFGLSFLEVYLNGDTRYAQFLVADSTLMAYFAYHP